MSYYVTREKVEANQALLEAILQAVESEEPLTLTVDDPNWLEREYYIIRGILKSAEAYPDLFGGKYAHLAKAAAFKKNFEEGTFTIRARHTLKHSTARSSSAPRQDDVGAIRQLMDTTKDLVQLEFTTQPSFDRLTFEGAALHQGWQVVWMEEEPYKPGRDRCGAQRIRDSQKKRELLEDWERRLAATAETAPPGPGGD